MGVYQDITQKMVLDLGCGCSVLGIGSALMGASYVLGVDIDHDALDIAKSNIDYTELTNINFLQCDIKNLPRILNLEQNITRDLIVCLLKLLFNQSRKMELFTPCTKLQPGTSFTVSQRAGTQTPEFWLSYTTICQQLINSTANLQLI